MAMPKHRQTTVHSHAGLSGPFRSVRMLEIDGQSAVHRQTDRLSGCYAVAGRKTGRSFAYHKLFEKVMFSPEAYQRSDVVSNFFVSRIRIPQ